jgi:hypothetical protein
MGLSPSVRFALTRGARRTSINRFTSNKSGSLQSAGFETMKAKRRPFTNPSTKNVSPPIAQPHVLPLRADRSGIRFKALRLFSTGISDTTQSAWSTVAVSPSFRYRALQVSARPEDMAWPVVLPRKGARHTRSSGFVALDSGSQCAARSKASFSSTAGHPRLRSMGCESVPVPQATSMHSDRHRPASRHILANRLQYECF